MSNEIPADDRAEFDDGRVSIPLVMLDGNLDALLESVIPVEGISLKRHASGRGVVLVVNMTPDQKLAAKALGFKTANY
jgi:hypothetical protein